MVKRSKTLWTILIAVLVLGFIYWSSTTGNRGLAGFVEIDGSSTVFPITQAVAEEFQKFFPDVYPIVGVSGTGGGFKRFTVGETDINDASRPIKDSEMQAAAENGVTFIEFEIALDGIAVVVNHDNIWVDYLTVEELNLIWNPESMVETWNDIRPEWPSQPIRLYGPGTDSGTFDYFTEVIIGESGSSRADYTASEDDNVLIQGIAGDPYGLGYFGYAYYAENTDVLKIVPIDSGNGPVIPSDQTINSGEYSPLSRPLFIYVNQASLLRSEVENFVRFYMENAEDLVAEVGYTPLPTSIYQQNLGILDQQT